MHKRNLRVLITTALAVGSTTVLTAQAAQARVIDSPLTISSFGQVAVDGDHQHVFISDPESGDIAVADYAASSVTKLTGLAGVRSLLVAGDVLYAAVVDEDEIVAFDTTTLTQTATYRLGDDITPAALARSGDTLWFSYSTGDSTMGTAKHSLGSLDLAGTDHAVALFPDLHDEFVNGAPLVAVSAADPDLIAAVDPGSGPGTVVLFDTSSGTPVRVTQRRTDDGGIVTDLAFSSDGTEVFETDSHAVNALSATDLSTVATYPTDYFAYAVAASSTGNVAVGSSNVRYYAQGSTTAVKTFSLHDPSDLVAAGGLAWEPGGPRIFAITNNGTSYEPWSLQVLNDPAKEATNLTLDPPTVSGTSTKPEIELEGVLFSAAGAVADAPVVITRTDPQSPNGVTVGTATTASNGTYTFTDAPPVSGTVTYSASYAGDDTYAGSTFTSTSVEVNVPKATTLTLDHNKAVYNYGTTVTFTAHLGSTYANRAVAIWADPAGSDQANRLLRSATADAKGNVTASFRLSRVTTVSAVYTGDARTLPITVKSVVYPHALVALSLSRQYKTAGGYAYFHKSVAPYFTTTINPYPGRKQYLEIQVWSGGKWRAYRSGYFTLLSNGKGYTQLTGAGKAGAKFRVRADYVYGKSGDTANVSTYGAFRYFTFTK